MVVGSGGRWSEHRIIARAPAAPLLRYQEIEGGRVVVLSLWCPV